MASTNFVDYSPATPIVAAWLNDVNTITYKDLNGPGGIAVSSGPTTGASLVGASPTAPITGTTVQAQLTAIAALLGTGAFPVEASVSAIRGLSSATVSRAFALGYYSIGDLGGGPYGHVSSDTTTGAFGQGSISGTTLTISSLTNGAYAVGQQVNGPNIQSGTYITAFVSGSGGLGTYTVNSNQTASAGVVVGDNGGSIIVGYDGGRWYLNNQSALTAKQFGAKGNNGASGWDDSWPLQYVFSTGKVGYVIPSGQYKFTTPISQNNSSDSFPIPGVPSARTTVWGENTGNTILQYAGTGYAITLTGADNSGVSQGINSLDTWGGFTLQDNALAKSNSGLAIVNKAWWKLERVYIQYTSVALNLDSCYSSEVDACIFGYSTYGVDLTATSLGACNQIAFNSCVFQNNSYAGVLGSNMGSNLSWNNCSFESNGTQGNSATGGLVGNLSAYGYSGPLKVSNGYFENNAGGGDIILDNPTAEPLTIDIDGCTFQRISNTNYVTSNIVVTNSGGGPVTVNLRNNTFISTGTYSPNASRPFWTAGSTAVQFVDRGGNVFNETTSLPSNWSSGTPFAMCCFVGASGAVETALNCTVTRNSVSSYTVTFNNPPRDANYAVSLTPDAAGQDAVGVQTVLKNQGAFQFVTVNQAGTGFDPTTISCFFYR